MKQVVVFVLWIASFVGGFYAAVNLSDPGPPPHWQHEFDTPPDVVDGLTVCVTGTLVDPGGFCTQEGWDPE